MFYLPLRIDPYMFEEPYDPSRASYKNQTPAEIEPAVPTKPHSHYLAEKVGVLSMWRHARIRSKS